MFLFLFSFVLISTDYYTDLILYILSLYEMESTDLNFKTMFQIIITN